MPAFVGRDVHGGRLAITVSDRLIEQSLGGVSDSLDVAQRALVGQSQVADGAGRQPQQPAYSRSLEEASAGGRQPAGRGPQDAESPARGHGAKHVAGAEHLVVVVRQDEHGRARSGAIAIRRFGGRPCFSCLGHKAIVR